MKNFKRALVIFGFSSLLFEVSCLSKQSSKEAPLPPPKEPIALNPDPKDPEPLPPEDPKPTARAEVLWPEVQAKVFNAHCTFCHGTDNTMGISDFSDVETVKATMGLIFYSTVVYASMPPPPPNQSEELPNPNQLTREEKDLLSHWVVDGMKTN